MQPLDQIIAQAKQNPRRIVLPESSDERILKAAQQAASEGLCHPVILGNHADITARLGATSGIEIIEPENAAKRGEYAKILFELRAAKGMTAQEAETAILNPLNFGAMMVRQGDADGAIAGAINATADVVRTALQIIGRAKGVQTVSSFFLMLLCEPHHQKQGAILFADCGLVIEPDAAQLAQIAQSTAQSYQSLFQKAAKVAMLSFSTSGSAKHPRVDLVTNALAIARDKNPQLLIEGDLQFDAAFVPEIAAAKSSTNLLKGEANVMVFPSLEAGNIGYKIAQRIGGAKAIGPILQGLAKPMNDLSRGCSIEDVFNLIAVTNVQAMG